MSYILEVLIGSVLFSILGMVWYSQSMFGNLWARLIELKSTKPNPIGFIGMILNSILLSIGLVWLFELIEPVNLFHAVCVGALASVLFLLPLNLGPVLWEQKNIKLFFINYGFNFTFYVILSAIIFFV